MKKKEKIGIIRCPYCDSEFGFFYKDIIEKDNTKYINCISNSCNHLIDINKNKVYNYTINIDT